MKTDDEGSSEDEVSTPEKLKGSSLQESGHGDVVILGSGSSGKNKRMMHDVAAQEVKIKRRLEDEFSTNSCIIKQKGIVIKKEEP